MPDGRALLVNACKKITQNHDSSVLHFSAEIRAVSIHFGSISWQKIDITELHSKEKERKEKAHL